MIGKRRTLVVKTALPVVFPAPGRVILTRKFIEGMGRYAELWDGPVRCLAQQVCRPTNNLDNVEVALRELPFEVRVCGAGGFDYGLQDAAALLSAVSACDEGMAAAARSAGVPVVLVTELSLRTRLQLLRATVRNPLLLARRMAWELAQERRQRRLIRAVAALQCNGLPTFKDYRRLNRHAMLYFDSRHTSETVQRAVVGDRLDSLLRGRPLQLAFSGRLIAIKGVDHLVPVAARLRALGVDFRLRILGAGECEGHLQRQVVKLGLQEVVQLVGSLPFAGEWQTLMRQQVDLFICCHRQGDPSCTYLEAMACGLPVVGYCNEALAGLMERSNAGLMVEMGDVEGLANLVLGLDRQRARLVRMTQCALDFAEENSFEQTFARRVEHVARAVLRRPGGQWLSRSLRPPAHLSELVTESGLK